MAGSVTDVWIATHDGRDMIRADALVVVRMDGGRLTAQLRDEARVSVTLLDGTGATAPPEDFHRLLIRAVAELADASGARLVRPLEGDDGWRWVSEPL